MKKKLQLLLALPLLLLLAADSPSAKTQQQSLAPLQKLVGQWRGVGQPRRGSTKDSWIEQADWIWRFGEDGAVLAMSSPKARYFRSATLRAGDQDGRYQLQAVTPEQVKVDYSGQLDKNQRLILARQGANGGSLPDRISLRFVAEGKRLIVLLERKSLGERYARLAEVGYTRKGSQFGKGASFVECIVTGGEGSMPVTYQGKTYYVCCTGCRDYFNDQPEKVLAEHRAKKEKEKGGD